MIFYACYTVDRSLNLRSICFDLGFGAVYQFSQAKSYMSQINVHSMSSINHAYKSTIFYIANDISINIKPPLVKEF